MRILKLRSFDRWAKSEMLSDDVLKNAINEILQGLIDVNLGAGLLKKRVARRGQGKRGGFRTILAFYCGNRAIFILGFPKNKTDNIGSEELRKLKELSRELLSATDMQINKRIVVGQLIEVKNYG
ncbi:MAG: type II toxin-antitoxin system RelE/ParE family toxin [Gammaproteobacteria bacterium]|nr:type II toxin-antitoxin system RelE/ParE family toxin [Gammaproteobacteria bacterium]